jgi:radical SAM protein with 4Fe4S-binding SPASM domain
VSGTTDEGLLRLGNVHEDIIDLNARAELCRDNADSRVRCTSCEYADDCSGGCPATNYQGTGSPYVPPAVDCAIARMFIRLGQGCSVCPDISFVGCGK